MNIFRKKDVSRDRTGMRRHLRLLDLILLGIGAMVGTGIFTITGTAAATLAGPALVISIIISALCVSISAFFMQNLRQEFLQMEVLIAISMLFLENFQLG